MKVKELAEWLLAFEDQDATVSIIEHLADGGGYNCQGGVANVEAFNPEKHVEYTDLRGNQFVKPDAPYYEARTLLLGTYNG